MTWVGGNENNDNASYLLSACFVLYTVLSSVYVLIILSNYYYPYVTGEKIEALKGLNDYPKHPNFLSLSFFVCKWRIIVKIK